nr:hypothetical protein GCM10025730_34420 [Promicromonospora thailandica]
MPEVVRPELELEAVLGVPERAAHDPGVVDEEVHRAVQVPGERTDRGERGEIQRTHLDPAGHAGGGGTALVLVADGEDDARPLAARAAAVARPMPLPPPVTIAVRPVWSGMCAGEGRTAMPGNVSSDNYVVNGYFRMLTG